MEGDETEKYLKEFETFIKTMETSLGWTPLHCMTEKENLNLVAKLIESSDVNAKDNFNRTPLSIAASKGNLEFIKLFIKKGAKINDGYPLHYSCEKGHIDAVLHLIQNGADVNLEKDKNYPIIIAAAKGFLQVVKILVENGAEVCVVDENKETALHWACENGNTELISFLIDAGCDINARDKYDISPLSACLIRKENEPELVKLLLKKGASIDTPDNYNYTLLHNSENPESTLELIKYGANVNAQNNDKETPLYSASFYGHIECAKTLLKQNANPNIAASGGWTPLHVSAKEGDLVYLEELLKRKANVNAASAQNVIPLHVAAREGHVEVVRKLLEDDSFIDVPVVDLRDIKSSTPYFLERDCISEGFTPLHLAAANNHVEVCKLLISHGANCQDISYLFQELTELKPGKKNINDWPCDETITAVRENNLEKIRNIAPNDKILHATDLIGWSLLHHSVSRGFNEMSAELIQKGLSVDSLDTYGRTPLTVAAARNHLTLVKLLLDNGADVNLGLPLHYAADKDSIECMLELINHNCDINIKNKRDSATPLLVEAASCSKTEIVKILLENNADPNCTNKWGETALHQSCRFNDVESVRSLLQHGANVNAVNSFKETPLKCATHCGNPDVIKLLLQNNANPEEADASKWTPLHHAACTNFEEVVHELIQAGVSIDPCNDEGETPLFLAAENINILKVFTENNADVNFVSFGGWSPLHEAAYCGKAECVKELLKHNAKVNKATAENVLPIYVASICGNVEVVEVLIQHGAYIDSPILDTGTIFLDAGNLPLSKRYHIIAGNTPIIGASSKGHLEVVKLLHSHGASLETANFEGNTALHEAVLNNCEEIVNFFIGLDVIDLNFKNKSQKTPLDLAKEYSNKGIIKMLSDQTERQRENEG